MNSLDRVLSALDGQITDRPPLFLNASLYGARLTGASLEDHYASAEVYCEGQTAVRETFSPDLLTGPFLMAALGEAFGSLTRTSPGQAPNVARFACGSAEEMLKLPLPDVDSHPRILYLRQAIRILSGRYAGEVPVFGILVSPADIPPLVIGLEAWMDALLFQPEAARALLDRLTPFFLDLGRAMLGDGATGLALTCNLANGFLVTDAVAEGLSLPNLRTALAEIPGPVIFHHGGCPMAGQLERFKGLPKVMGYVIDAGEDPGAARRILGPGPLVLGNLDGPGLVRQRPEAIRAQCERTLAQKGEDRQFILSTCRADIQLDTPREAIAAITEAAGRQGGGAA